MPSESIASFLDQVRENRILEPEDVDAIYRQPDVPQNNLAALCEFLRQRGVLTNYQSDAIRAGRGYELNFAGYPILEELGPCPGGTAYKGTHPSLRTPVVIRRLRTEWFAPLDNASAYLQRAQDAAPTTHPHLAHLLDAGVHREEPFAVLEPFDSADLETLIGDIGPMPALLAAEFIRQAATALQVAHQRHLAHGDVRPANLRAGPLVASTRRKADGTPLHRPAPTATVKLFELGLVPNRPISGADAYRAPEATGPSAEADIFALGGTLAFLLTAKPPTAPALLPSMRPDAPQSIVDLAIEMLASEPKARPTAAEVAARLSGILHGTVSVEAPKATLAESSSILGGGESEHLGVQAISEGAAVDLAEAADVDLASVADEPIQLAELPAPGGGWAAQQPYYPPPVEYPPPSYSPPEWGAEPVPSFDPHHEEEGSVRSAPRAVAKRGINKTKVAVWIAVGLLLNLIAFGIWGAIVFGVFEGPPAVEQKPDPKEQKLPKPKKGKPATA